MVWPAGIAPFSDPYQGALFRACQVEAPDRVLRMWALLKAADDELHQATLPLGAAAPLQRQL